MEEPHTRDGGMRLVLHAYPPEDGEGGGRLYSDSGDGYGPGRVDSFRLRREDGGLRLLWTGEGQYPPPHGSVEVQFHGMTIRRARVDGVDVRCDANRIRTRPFKEALVEP
jgi:alpha-glucosidase